MTSFLDSPHPLLKAPTLYLVDPPPRVKWHHLLQLFSPCDVVRSGGRGVSGGRKKWTILFSDVFHAEMALATLQGAAVPGIVPSWTAVLSHSPSLESSDPYPYARLFPQFVKSSTMSHPLDLLRTSTAPAIFRWFRNAGPLVSVRVDVDVGHPERTIVVEYWDPDHANVARREKQAIHPELRGSPAFTLRTFDPFNLYCARLGSAFRVQDMNDIFSKFGTIKDIRLMKVGIPDAYGFVSFESQEAAANAVRAMNNTVLGERSIIVRYHEPNNQTVFRYPSRPPAAGSKNEGMHPSSMPPKDSSNGNKAEEAAKAAAAAAARAREEQARRDATARQNEEFRRRRQQDNQRQKEEAERQELLARKRREDAENNEEEAAKLHELAELAYATANRDLTTAEEACAEAKRLWLEAVDRQTAATRKVEDAKTKQQHAYQNKQQAEIYRKIAEQEELAFRAARKKAEEEQKEEEIDEEAQRRAELEESIRRMRELRELEEADRIAQARKDSEAEEAEANRRKSEVEQVEQEKRQREKEEAEKKALEQQEREERERREAEERQRMYAQYEHAAAKERARCWQRDEGIVSGRRFLWYHALALKRFQSVSAEFDGIKFHHAQPLTFESIPWPVLTSPYNMSLEHIEWNAVESFFSAIAKLVPDQEYRSLVEKTHRRFHPDKWKARGLLNTVLDETLQSQLEAAGNVVAQAMTPIWLKTKN